MTKPQVVPLHNPRLPRDHGLSGLGLLMQLAGGMFAVITGLSGFMQLFAIGQFGGRAGSEVLWMLLIVALGVARSAYHRNAGTEILYGHAPRAAVRRYVVFSLVHTAALLGFLKLGVELPNAVLFAVALLFLAWPVTVGAMVARLPVTDGELVPLAEDRGIEGAGILMVILGLTGAMFTLMMLKTMFDVPSGIVSMRDFLVIVLALLFARSVVHVHAGVTAVRCRELAKVNAATSRYANLGVLSSVAACAALLIVGMSAGAGGGFLMMFFLIGVGALLLVWPVTIRRFILEPRLEDAMRADIPDVTPDAPDRGLTALGWLLLALGVLALANVVPMLVFGAAGADGFGLTELTPRAVGSSPWVALGVAALQTWAGYELVTMSDRHKLAGTAYGAIAAIIGIIANAEVLDNLSRLGGGGRLVEMSGSTAFGSLALALIVPIATVILVNRPARPLAQARFVAKDPGGAPEA